MTNLTRFLAASLALALCVPTLRAEPFTYQGMLEFNGTPVHGSADLHFRLFDAETDGSELGLVTGSDWPVAQGVFTIDLDFPGVAFDGSPRWLQVEADGQVLAGRIPVLGAPFAHSANALRGRGVATTVPGTGQVLAWNGSAWAPADAAAGSNYLAGTGLDRSGETFSILSDYRLPQSCSGDQLPKWSGSAWACAADADTTYSQGTGLDLSGTTFSLAPAFRLPAGGCGATEVAKWNGSAWACAADTDTTYSADTGLAVTGTAFSVAPSYRLPQACGAGEVAKWNGSAWICAADADTTYDAGNGLSLIAGDFAVDFAGTGSAESAARSDHDHYGTSWSGNTDFAGLAVFNSAASAGAAIQGFHNGAISDATGVYGESSGGYGVRGFGLIGVRGSSTTANGTGVLGIAFANSGSGAGVEASAGSPDGYGLWARNASTTGAAVGVHGESASTDGIAVRGNATATDPGAATGVLGTSTTVGGYGVLGQGSTGVRGSGGTGVSAEGLQFGVSGLATDTTGVGVEGIASSATGNTAGVLARAFSPTGVALKAENYADDAVTALVQAQGSGATVGLRSESYGEDPDAMAVHALLANGSGAGAALFAEHRGGGVAAKLDGVLRMTPRSSPPASCELGDLYVHDSGGLCFCSVLLVWEQINPTGICP